MTMDTTLLTAICGRWSGDETLVTGPGADASISATGRFENTPAFGGAGFVAVYSQDVGDKPGMRCVTTFHVDASGAATAVWIPEDGPPQSLEGKLAGGVFTLSRTDEDGLRHTLVADYSNPSAMSNSMAIQPPGAEAMTVFEGRYHKTPAPDGRPV